MVTEERALKLKLKDRIDQELKSGERILWVGQPSGRNYMLRALPLVLFGVPFLGVAAIWLYLALRSLLRRNAEQAWLALAGRAGVTLAGVAAFILAVALILSPIAALYRARRTLYAVTDRRLLVWSADWVGRVKRKTYEASDLKDVELRDRSSEVGDLLLVLRTDAAGAGRRDRILAAGEFLAIERVREVHALVRATHLEGRGSSPQGIRLNDS